MAHDARPSTWPTSAAGPLGAEYRATSFTPAITAELLDTAVGPPAKIRTSMTAVPDDLPDVITTRAGR